MRPRGLQAGGLALDGLALGAEGSPARVVHEPQLAAGFRQTQVGVVLAKLQPVLGAAGEHAIGLGNAPGDEVVHQHAQVGLVAPRAPAGVAPRVQRRVDAGEEPLRGGLLVARGAVDLPGEEEPPDGLGLERCLEAPGVEVVVLDRVAGPHEVRVLQPRWSAPAPLARRRGGWWRCRWGSTRGW